MSDGRFVDVGRRVRYHGRVYLVVGRLGHSYQLAPEVGPGEYGAMITLGPSTYRDSTTPVRTTRPKDRPDEADPPAPDHDQP